MIILIAGTVLTGLFALSVATRATIAIDEHTYFLMDGILYRVGAVMLCAAFVLVFRTQKAEKQYVQHLRRVAGGDVPTGTYELARAHGRKIFAGDEAFGLSREDGTQFTFEYGMLRADACDMALNASHDLLYQDGTEVDRGGRPNMVFHADGGLKHGQRESADFVYCGALLQRGGGAAVFVEAAGGVAR